MTYEEAMKILIGRKQHYEMQEEALFIAEAMGVAIESLKKQIPKKPIEKIEVQPVIDGGGAYVDADVFVNLHCPSCDNWVGMADNGCSEFCNQCGQRIDESEME